jgi:hypothetical protein
MVRHPTCPLRQVEFSDICQRRKLPHALRSRYIARMVDTRSPEQRRRIMQSVKTKDTGPELTVRRALFAAGYRFRLRPQIGSGHSRVPRKPRSTQLAGFIPSRRTLDTGELRLFPEVTRIIGPAWTSYLVTVNPARRVPQAVGSKERIGYSYWIGQFRKTALIDRRLLVALQFATPHCVRPALCLHRTA